MKARTAAPKSVEPFASGPVESIDGVFLDPIELFELVRTAAAEVDVAIEGQVQLPWYKQPQPLTPNAHTVAQLQAFVAELLAKVTISRDFASTGHNEPSRYTIEFTFDPGEHEFGQGGLTKKATRLVKDGCTVLSSVRSVRYATSFDDADDISTHQDNRTDFAQEDLLSQCIFDSVRRSHLRRPR